MKYIDPRWVRAVKLSDASPNSLVITSSYGKSIWLVSELPDSVAAVISGEHLGSGMLIKTAANWYGYAVEGVDIEVDLDSADHQRQAGSKRLALQRRGTALTLLVKLDNGRGSSDWADVIVVSGLAPCSTEQQVIFTKWRIVKRVGDNTVTLIEVDADA